MSAPYLFDEFFASGRAEAISPFLTPSSRKWSKDLPLKSALLAALLLALAFALSFIQKDASHLLLAGVYFLVGTPALIGAIEDLRNFEINIDVLMTLAALLSVVIGSGMEGGLLLVLFELSAAMENGVTEKTKGALISLRRLSPQVAWALGEEGNYIQRAVRDLPIGAQILVRASEVVPLDGKVIAGSSFVNLVHLTGESVPIAKRVGDEVAAGARNLDGSLTLEITRVATDSTLSKIIQLITQAQEAKPQLERLLDRFGKWYASTIILLSLLFTFTLPHFFGLPYLGEEGAIYRALTFLIAASPCALIIATPTAYLSAISACARRGILLKGGTILDALASCTLTAFDKTGTLTTGSLSCHHIERMHGTTSIEEALAIAAGLEQGAVHPMAEAIIQEANEQKIIPASISDFNAVAGYGLEGTTSAGARTLIGHPDFILPHLSQEALAAYEKNRPDSLSSLLLIGEELFCFHYKDELRKESLPSLEALRKESKLTIALLTGDHSAATHQVAETLGIEKIFFDLRPEDKLDKVAELSKKGGLIMVGDGVNDAPALARATVGISMGKIGSATAVDASDVVFLRDDLSHLNWLVLKARKTMRVVKENLILALAVILLATTPALLGWVPLWLAVILHEGGTVLVGLNSLRLLR